jgi:hypothetical protein
MYPTVLPENIFAETLSRQRTEIAVISPATDYGAKSASAIF